MAYEYRYINSHFVGRSKTKKTSQYDGYISFAKQIQAINLARNSDYDIYNLFNIISIKSHHQEHKIAGETSKLQPFTREDVGEG